ncbi:hypothetical protein [Sporosarcina sp. G11-34]|uniref:hypothetical protein n=1 Tax=Sporosarcina sp. G11-34 TaxID=2849605 RepID=UPI0022A915F6|nr:hypothetical protein [Sporosarcina sp. G11-34]MCZ2257871.1 hypothetical protein [Sporosarcina sp. G11-34]
MRGNYPLSGEGLQNKDSSQDYGAKIGLLGAAISTFGDALQTIGGAIAIEEGRISDKQQEQEIGKLQSQIDELKKEQSENNAMSIEVELLNKQLKRIIGKLEMDDESSENFKTKKKK